MPEDVVRAFETMGKENGYTPNGKTVHDFDRYQHRLVRGDAAIGIREIPVQKGDLVVIGFKVKARGMMTDADYKLCDRVEEILKSRGMPIAEVDVHPPKPAIRPRVAYMPSAQTF